MTYEIQETHPHYQILTSSDSERNSCIMSLSPMTLTEHTSDNKGHRIEVVHRIERQPF